MAPRFELSRRYFFEAAHRNARGDEKARRVHGHNYIVEVALEDRIDTEIGWFIDFGDLDAQVRPVLERLDHHYVNDATGTESATRQTVAVWISSQLSATLKNVKAVRVDIEGPTRFVLRQYEAERAHGWPERLGFYFHAAHRLTKAPPEHKCGGLHGHSFRMEVAAPDLDALAARLRVLHDALDHKVLNDIKGLENPTSENIAIWAWDRLWIGTPGLEMIVVRETPQACCVYRGPAR